MNPQTAKKMVIVLAEKQQLSQLQLCHKLKIRTKTLRQIYNDEMIDEPLQLRLIKVFCQLDRYQTMSK